jgi:CBS-domain-containing membrane protein
MRIEEVMTRDVVVCRADDSAGYVARLMWDHDCGVIPVVDEERRPIGMITDRDVCMAGLTTGRSLFDIRVAEAMSKGVRACRVNDSISAAEAVMRQAHVRRLPIVDESGHLVGLLSMNDLARAACERLQKHRDMQAAARVVETLASVSRPWCNILDRPAAEPPSALASRGSLVSVPIMPS